MSECGHVYKSVLGDSRCERETGHSGPHKDARHTWASDALCEGRFVSSLTGASYCCVRGAGHEGDHSTGGGSDNWPPFTWKQERTDDWNDSARVQRPAVSAPAHYKSGKIEVIDIIESVVEQISDPRQAFLTGQVLKYACRWFAKGAPDEDLLKARQYLNRLIEARKGNYSWGSNDT